MLREYYIIVLLRSLSLKFSTLPEKIFKLLRDGLHCGVLLSARSYREPETCFRLNKPLRKWGMSSEDRARCLLFSRILIDHFLYGISWLPCISCKNLWS